MKANELSEASRPDQDAVEKVYRAIALTRAGKHVESREIYDEYHDSSKFGVDIDLSIMLMLLDGLRIYYEKHETPAALKRIERALAIAQASVGCDVIDVVATWAAHLQFNIGSHAAMGKSINLALSKGALRNQRAAVRLFLTMGDAYCLAGDFDKARTFYERARGVATAIGDTLSTAAIAHNRSTMALSHARFGEATGSPVSNSYQTFLSELDSAENFESYLRVTSVLHPYDVWQPRLDLLRGKFEVAKTSLHSLLESKAEALTASIRTALKVDLAYATFQAGGAGEAVDQVMHVISENNCDSMPSDDRAVLYSHASRILRAAGFEDRAKDLDALMCSAKDEFLRETSELRSIVAEIETRMTAAIAS
ncbi:MAG: hypothetical protein HYZ20_15225 [Burkholderiales bacterium]|nr:hypothetical protein [Burkholderiales bacterium]